MPETASVFAVLGRHRLSHDATCRRGCRCDVHVGREVAARVDRVRAIGRSIETSPSAGAEIDLGRRELVLEAARGDDQIAPNGMLSGASASPALAAVAGDLPGDADGQARLAVPQREAVPGRERAAGAELAQRRRHTLAQRLIEERAEVELRVRVGVAQEELAGTLARGDVVTRTCRIVEPGTGGASRWRGDARRGVRCGAASLGRAAARDPRGGSHAHAEQTIEIPTAASARRRGPAG